MLSYGDIFRMGRPSNPFIHGVWIKPRPRWCFHLIHVHVCFWTLIFWGYFSTCFYSSISGESILAQQLSCICDGTAAGGARHLTADVLDSFLAMAAEDGGGWWRSGLATFKKVNGIFLQQHMGKIKENQPEINVINVWTLLYWDWIGPVLATCNPMNS